MERELFIFVCDRRDAGIAASITELRVRAMQNKRGHGVTNFGHRWDGLSDSGTERQSNKNFHRTSMKAVKDEGVGNHFGVRYRNGLFLLLMSFTLMSYMMWYIESFDGSVRLYSPTILPYMQIRPVLHSTMNDVTSSVAFPTTRTIKPSVSPTSAPEAQVNPHNFRYIFHGNNTCKSRNKTDVFLLITVCVAPANFKHREVIRNTWGSIAKHNQEVRLIFLLGKINNETIQLKINKENTEFDDIVQEDFVDSYRNLSLKSVAILKWTMTYCSRVKYVLKADDDVFINVPYLIGVLKHKHLTNSVIGFVNHGARPIQNPASKWYTPQHMFKEAVYPPYTSGTAYVISSDIVSKLYHASLRIPLFWLEDVYITGLCRRKIGAVAAHDNGFTYSHRSPTGCTYKNTIVGHDNTREEIMKIWQELHDPNLKC
ncbi:beta-1,3-galactosyltransferase 1-like [Ylistrum balloti]|uniref:beta-1,3-galactosyltransferase 1-like n=1 Tax=Ylistrum balloti TaxID=509963 RepID=UPI002905B557|nr:beta-1,3-galactosyltransferase 1-like [Ylistrum balloti]